MADSNASLSGMTLEQLPYLGPARAATLRARGIETPEQLRALSDAEIAAIGFLGMANALRIRNVLNGGTHSPVPRRRRSRAAGAAAPAPAAAAKPARTTRRKRAATPAAAKAPRPRTRRRTTQDALPAGPTPGALPAAPEPAALGNGRTARRRGPRPAADSQDIIDFSVALEARRRQIPPAVESLTSAIRAQAVSTRLERQLDRLLAAIEEISARQSGLSSRQQRRAVLLVNRTQALVEAAAARKRLGQNRQGQLADRIRANRRELERLVRPS